MEGRGRRDRLPRTIRKQFQMMDKFTILIVELISQAYTHVKNFQIVYFMPFYCMSFYFNKAVSLFKKDEGTSILFW